MNSAKRTTAAKNKCSILGARWQRDSRTTSTATLRRASTFLFCLALLVAVAQPGRAQTQTVLYSFSGGADGVYPFAGLVQDAQGILYGATPQGGTYYAGTVFLVTPKGAEKVLYSFKGGLDGRSPSGGLVRDAQGNLYGATSEGGAYNLGTVFRVSPTGAEKVLYSFSGGADGSTPASGVILDAQGNLYGTTLYGGTYDQGTVFRVTLFGEEKVLYSFGAGQDARYPYASLIQDSRGILYGTTYLGGAYNAGTVFRLTLSGTEKVLCSFSGGVDAVNPSSGLVQDAQGNLYGTTYTGGASNRGTVFVVSATGTEKVLFSFSGGLDGSGPYAGLIGDAQGNFYGTTEGGGSYSQGTVFRLAASGSEKVLYSFSTGVNGFTPYGGLVRDAQGNLYGTTANGGTYSLGTVFKLAP